jgi:hypothetical protein
MLKSLTVLAVSAAAVLPALAAESGWKAWEGNDPAAPRAIFTQADDAPGVVLVCKAYGDLGAFLSLEAGDVANAMTKRAPYARAADSALTVDGADPVATTLRYIPAIRVVEAREHGIAARMFNAAVEGKSFALDVKTGGGKREAVTFALPAPDATFDAFAKRCAEARAEEK